MSESANISSLDAVRGFMTAVIQFQSEARTSLAAFETQLNRITFWLERERPDFWKREIEKCMREAAEARVRLHQCRMRRVGDFRPSCIEEVKDLEKNKRALAFAQKQIPIVKRWRINALHEANEFHGRSSQLVQLLEREIPQLLRVLRESIDRIETYAGVRGPDAHQTVSGVTQLAAQLESELHEQQPAESTENAVDNSAPAPTGQDHDDSADVTSDSQSDSREATT
jgi:hypothetical protein